ncbi:MAG: hypothetical protein JWN48_3459 [Myxococcaceae bacterium]|nr:hypothetical protein [Myxococcaceae bacterium]
MKGRRLSDYVDAYRASGELTFDAAAIVLEGEVEADAGQSDVTAMGQAGQPLPPPRPSMRRSLADLGALSAVPPGPPQRGSASTRGRDDLSLVFMLVKRPANAFDYISVGRAPHLDVVLPLAQVSKFHAYFHRESADEYLIADAGSTNGTWIGARRLAVRRPEAVQNGTRLRLGLYSFTFVTQRGLAELVKSRTV